MYNNRIWLVLLGAAGLSACGTLQPVPVQQTELSRPEGALEFTQQGTFPLCTSPSAGGNYPYSTTGPYWRQWIYLNDNGTPLNYSTFTTDLLPINAFNLQAYTYTAAGSTTYASPLIYQYLYSPGLTISGKLASTGAQINEVYVNGTGSYGTTYLGSVKQYELPVFSTANPFKLLDANGNVIKDASGNEIINPATQTYAPTINGNRVRLPAGQNNTKFEYYLDPTVKYRPEIIQANYKDPATGAQKNDWVKVDMPYQEGYLKISTSSYIVYEPGGQKTYQTSTNPLPKFKFMMRGFKNAVTTDRRFVNLQGIYYTRPYGIGSDQASLNTWLDGRNEIINNWSVYGQKIASATLDANGDPVINAATVTTKANWNLGTPGYANDRNCISKTFAVENVATQRFSVVQPGGSGSWGTPLNDTQQGLKTTTFDNADFTSKRFDTLSPDINANWGAYSPYSYTSPETYSIRWSGTVKPAYSEDYTFYFTGGHGARLWVNGALLVNNWNVATPSTFSGTLNLKAGVKYDIAVEYKHNQGNATAKLEWSSPSQVRQVVPSTSLNPVSTDAVNIVNQLSALPWVQAKGLNLNPQWVKTVKYSNATVNNGPATLYYMGIPGSTNRILAFIGMRGLEFAYHFDVTGPDLIITEAQHGKEMNLGPRSSYVNADGSFKDDQAYIALQSFILKSDLNLSDRADPLAGVFYRNCGGCNVFYDDYINKYKTAAPLVIDILKNTINGVQDCKAANGGASSTAEGGWCVSSWSQITSNGLNLYKTFSTWLEARVKVVYCIFKTGPNMNPAEACPSKLVWDSIYAVPTLRIPVGSSGTLQYSSGNSNSASADLSYTINLQNDQGTPAVGTIQLTSPSRETLKPGQMSNVVVSAFCSAPGQMTASPYYKLLPYEFFGYSTWTGKTFRVECY